MVCYLLIQTLILHLNVYHATFEATAHALQQKI